jgi:tRNA pseudouridine(38-40) synthase
MASISSVARNVRRSDGFARYAVSLQYHGGSFLGFSYQKNQEDKLLPDGTDLRGYRSVEGRIRQALADLFGKEHEKWENIQVSSRTDRGVHALRNTFHVDVKHAPKETSHDIVHKLRKGLNFHLSRQQSSWERDSIDPSQLNRKISRKKRQQSSFSYLGTDSWTRYSPTNEVRILSAGRAPEFMVNEYAATQDSTQPPLVDWNARFSATQRTYIYRILSYHDEVVAEEEDHGTPFEWDRSWRIRGGVDAAGIDVEAMQAGAKNLEGTHDFSTFRGKNCQRQSPIVTIRSIQVHCEPYGIPSSIGGGLLGLGVGRVLQGPQLVTISIVGNSFLYRQVRNMVGCLVEVGRGKLQPKDIPEILGSKQRSLAPRMAPAHGLFLVDVQHGDFYF